MSRAAWITVIVLGFVYAVLGHRYMALWESDQTLWPYAAHQTPLNPVPVVNAEMVRRR